MSDKPISINERLVKISSRLPINSPIALGDDVEVIINNQRFTMNVVKTEDYDLQDGQIDRVFVLKYLNE